MVNSVAQVKFQPAKNKLYLRASIFANNNIDASCQIYGKYYEIIS